MRRKRKEDGRLQTSFRFKGKRYYVCAKTPEELREKENKKREDLERGIELRVDPTLDEYHERWERARVEVVKETSARNLGIWYRSCADVKIKTAARRLGDIKLKEITADDIREVQSALRETRKTQTVNDYINHLSHIFKDAIMERILDYNPCDPVRSLKRVEEEARDLIHRALTDEEANVFMEAARDSFYFDSFRMMLNTGIRVGELGALRLSDIRNNMLCIERTVTRTVTGGYVIGDSAKTAAGRREIPINDTIREIINHQQEINRMLDGDKVLSIHDTIFKAPERGLLLSTPVDREIRRICKRTGIERFTSHAFRATFCTRMIANGVPVKAIQEIMGHRDVAMTLGLYGHAQLGDKVDAMKAMERGKAAVEIIPFRKEA